MKSSPKLLAVLAMAFALIAQGGIHAADIMVFAAASLTDSLREIGANYEKSSGDKVVFNFGASSTLALQIREGAPADIFFSADEAKMNNLAQRNLILADTRQNLLGNTLVVVALKESDLPFKTIHDLKSSAVKKIALAEPRSVPAGVYSKSHLQKIGLWNAVIDKVVPTENVRAALAAVESGNVDVALVYKTDALISKKVKVLHEISIQDGPEIRYPVAVVRDAKQLDRARQFVNHLASTNALTIFRKYGFITLGARGQGSKGDAPNR